MCFFLSKLHYTFLYLIVSSTFIVPSTLIVSITLTYLIFVTHALTSPIDTVCSLVLALRAIGTLFKDNGCDKKIEFPSENISITGLSDRNWEFV